MANLTDLEMLVARLAAINFSQSSEQATREIAVNPLIAALGWDTFDPNEVDREYSVRGGRVDYCLRGPKGNLVLIEVKRTGIDLNDHQEQLLRYAFDEGVPMAALTDGLVWWLYLPMAGGSWEQRRFNHIDLQDQAPRQATVALYRFLNRDGLMDGSALVHAQGEFESQARDRLVRSALRDAWTRVLNDPKSLLRDLLTESVQEISGHAPSQEILREFLEGVAGNEHASLTPHPARRRREPPPTVAATPKLEPAPAPRGESGTLSPGSRPLAFWLDGKRHDVKNWRRMLVRVCELLASEPGPPFSERVVGLQGRKRPYFSSSGAELRSPIQIPGLDLFVEGNISAHQAERLARRTVETIKGPDHSFSVELVGESASASKPTSTMGAPDTRSPPPTSESFTGLRPGAYFLDGKRHEVTRWNEVLLGICNRLAKETGSDFGKFVSSIRGTTRLYFSESAEKLHSPLRLSNSTVYVEGKFSANDCVRLARRVLVSVRGSDEGFRIEPEGASKT